MKKNFKRRLSSALLFLTLSLGLILISFPFFNSKLFEVHDYVHGARIAEMKRALNDGHFPVRWSQNFGFGYGMPLFQFYGPLPYYFGVLVYLLSGSLIFSVKSIFLLCNFLTLVGGFLLGKKLFKSHLSATFLSLLITISPYRILNLYVRGAANELWGIMSLPWIFWSITKIIKNEKHSYLWLTASLSVLFLSHNISTLIFAPFIILFALIVFFTQFLKGKIVNKSNWKTSVFRLFAGGFLAVGLSSFYLFPAFFEKGFTQVDQYILSDYFNYQVHFLYPKQFLRTSWDYGGSEWGPNDPISFFLGYGQWLMIILATVLLLINTVQSLKSGDLTNFFRKNFLIVLTFLGLGFSLLMSLHYSHLIWESIGLLRYVQFPWRFLGVSIVFIGLIGGWVISQISLLKKTGNQTIFLGVIIFLIFLNTRFVKPKSYLIDSNKYYYADESRIQAEMSQVLPDYIPVNLTLNEPPADIFIVSPQNKNDEVTLERNKVQSKKMNLSLSQDSEIQFSVAEFAGWQAYIDNKQVDHIVSDQGLISVSVPKEASTVELRYKSTTLRKISDSISAFSLMVFCGLIINSLSRKFLNASKA